MAEKVSKFNSVIAWLGFGEVSAEYLQTDRHRRLSVAVPFPDHLKWSEAGEIDKSLRALHDFAVGLAYSAIDWYGRKRTWKKAWARSVHVLAYLLAIAGIAVPLLNILPPLSDWVRSKGSNFTSDHAAELALVLLAFAGGINVLDRLVGFTSGWMSYMSTSMQLNQELIKFQFEWNELEMKAAAAKKAVGNAASPVPVGCICACATEDDIKVASIELARTFCLRVLEIVRNETSGWADELRKISQLTDQLPAIRASSRKP